MVFLFSHSQSKKNFQMRLALIVSAREGKLNLIIFRENKLSYPDPS